MINGISEVEKSVPDSASVSEMAGRNVMNRLSDDVLGQALKVKPRWASDAERLNRAKTALRQTMNQANKILETIKYFRSFHARPCEVQDTGSSIYESVNQVLHAMSYEYPFRKITLVKMIPKDMPRILISREHLDTIFFQLVFQARRAIGEGSGIITIEAREEIYLSPGSVSVKYFEIRVADTGGSPSDDSSPWPELSDSDESERGLGFYVAKRLVELNKGTFRADNQRRGNAFFIKFLSPERRGESCLL